MRKEEERTFFGIYKNGGVADLCVQALTVKYDLDKHICNSKKGHSDEEKSILYKEAIKAIKVAEEALKVDFDKLFDEIEENLNELTENVPQRKSYCWELLATFGSQCSFIDTYMPIAAVKAHQHPKIELNEEEKDTLKIFKGFQMFYIATRESIPQDGIVEEHYRSLFSLLQQYADRLDWVLMKKRIDLCALQNECGIYIKDMRMERSAWSYTKWAGSIKIAQKYIDALYANIPQLDEIRISQTSKKKRGRPIATAFKDNLMCDDIEGKLCLLHKLLKNKKGREVALVMRACMKIGWLTTKPTFKQVAGEFEGIGNRSGYDKYMNENYNYRIDELNSVISFLK